MPMLHTQVCQSAAANCRTKVVDLVFMLPSSNSVASSGWANIISFVRHIVSALDVDSGLARVGLLRYLFFALCYERDVRLSVRPSVCYVG